MDSVVWLAGLTDRSGEQVEEARLAAVELIGLRAEVRRLRSLVDRVRAEWEGCDE